MGSRSCREPYVLFLNGHVCEPDLVLFQVQLMALEQLCMILLTSGNIDRCFEICPPRTFLPALFRIFMDETAPDNVLEVSNSFELSLISVLQDSCISLLIKKRIFTISVLRLCVTC